MTDLRNPARPRGDTSRDVMLSPGGFFFGGADTRVHTLLGSCVSITVWHPWRRIGGMCHYMLPARPGRPAGEHALDGRYADDALRMFLRELDRSGTRPEEYEVKMFGGGNQFPFSPGATAMDVARDNIVAGLWLLDNHGFVLRSRQLGGTGARRLLFDLSSGNVWLNWLGAASADATRRTRDRERPTAWNERPQALSGSSA